MSHPLAIAGTYSDLRFIKSRKVAQVIIEIPLEAADAFVRAFGAPNPAAEIPVAIARLETQPDLTFVENDTWGQPQPEPPLPEGVVRTFNPCGQANVRCKSPEFWKFLSVHIANCADEVRAAHLVRSHCGVGSRSELNHDEAAAAAWRDLNNQFWVWQRDVRAQT